MEDGRIWADRDGVTEALDARLDEHSLKTNVEDCEASGGLC